MPESGFPTSASGFDTTVVFTAPAQVVAGTQYAIVLYLTACTPTDPPFGCSSRYVMQADAGSQTPNGPYPGGRLLNSTSTSGPWSDEGGGTCIGCWDAGFRTYVTTTTAVELAGFSAQRTKRGVTITWQTASESRIAGFNLWRSSGAGWRQVNRSLIVARHAGQPAGAAYRYLDRTAPRGSPASYRLQIVDVTGTNRWYRAGAASVRYQSGRGSRHWPLHRQRHGSRLSLRCRVDETG